MKLIPNLILFLIILLFDNFSLAVNNSASHTQETTAQEFDHLFSQFKDRVTKTPHLSFSSSRSDYMKLDEYHNIRSLGIPAIPFMIEKMKEEKGVYGSILEVTIRDISKKSFPQDIHGKPTHLKYIEWWENERQHEQREFEALYEKWKSLSDDLKFKRPFTIDVDKDLAQIKGSQELPIDRWIALPEGPEKERLRPFQKTDYQKLLDLGIGVLPFAIEKLGEGDLDILDAIHYWTGNTLKEEMTQKNVTTEQTAQFVKQWWEINKAKWTYPPIEN